MSVGRPPREPVPRRRVRLVWTLLAVMLATSLVPLFITAYALIDISRESLESATREYQLQIAGSIGSRIGSSLASARRRVAAAAEAMQPLIEREPAGASSAEEVRDRLRPYLTEEVVLIRFTAPAGSLAQVGSTEGLDAQAIQQGIFEGFSIAMEGSSSSGMPVLLGRMDDGGGPRTGAIISAPVLLGDRPSGVVAAVLDLSSTWRRGVGDVGQDYAVFAVDSEGTLLAQANLPEALADGTFRRLEIVQRFLSSRGTIREAMPVTIPGGVFRRELLAASAPTDMGLGLFVLVDRSLAYHAAVEMRNKVYQWALFAVALAALAAILAAELVTRPLAALVDGARRLARGEFGATVTVQSRSEIGELAGTFNRMAEEIRNHIQRLDAALEENQLLFLGTIRALAAAIDEKDPYTRGHSERVNRYAVAIAKRMGLSNPDVRDVMIGALLHDVGKIGIEDAILRKPSALTNEEFQIMKRHPEKGSHIMASIPQMNRIIGGIRNHHERWGGGGYPDDLKGEQIPLIARIVQVADAFDAITTDRPYQRAMRFEAAVARIRELTGIVFDPKVVDAFQEAWIAGDIRSEVRPAARVAAAARGVEVGS